MSRRKRLPKMRVVERKLGRERAWGQCWQHRGLVEIDPRQDSKSYLNTMLHEMLHLYFKPASEWTVANVADRMSDALWRKGYRRIMD